MLLLMAALQQMVAVPLPIPPAPPPPPPFSRKVEAAADRIGARVNREFERCGDARTNSNGRHVDAMGSPAHSAQWSRAMVALESALTICQGLQRALRDQEDFLVGVVRNGNSHDADLAAGQLTGVLSELQATEQFFATEAPRYRELMRTGWASPHCDAGPLTGFERPGSVCPGAAAAPQ